MRRSPLAPAGRQLPFTGRGEALPARVGRSVVAQAPAGAAVVAVQVGCGLHHESFGDGRARGGAFAGQRCDDPQVDRGLQLAAERGPDVRGGRSAGSRPRRFQLHGQAEFGEASGLHPGGQYVGADEGTQHLGEQAVFVLRAVGPGGDQIGQLEPARRGPPAGDHALLVVRLGRAGAPSARVLADAVQEDADGRGVTAGGPVLRRGVEDQVDAAVLQSGLGQQQPQPLVDFVDHRRITSSGGVMVPSTTRKSVFTGLKPGPFAVIVRDRSGPWPR